MENGTVSSLGSSTGIQQSSHHYLPLLMSNGKSMSGSVFSLLGSDPVVTSMESITTTNNGSNGTNGTNGIRKDSRLVSTLPPTSTTASTDPKALPSLVSTINTPLSSEQAQHPIPPQKDTAMASSKHNIPADDIITKPDSIASSVSTVVSTTKSVPSTGPPPSKTSSSTKSNSPNSKSSTTTGCKSGDSSASKSSAADLIDGTLSDFDGSDLSDLSSVSSASGSDQDSDGDNGKDGDQNDDDDDESSLDEAASDDSKMGDDNGDSGSNDSSSSDDSDSHPIPITKKRANIKKSARPRIQSDSSDGERDQGIPKRGPGRPPKAKQHNAKSKTARSPTTPTSPTFAAHTHAKKNGNKATEESTMTESGFQASNEPQSRKKSKMPDLTNINKRDRSGRTQLFKYTAMGNLEACKMLIEAGAQVNDRDNAEWTPLHEACVTGHDKVAELLIQHHADVNARGGHLDTPLHDAAQNGHVEVVKLLLSHGANVLAKNAKGVIPIDVSDDKEVIDLLQRRQALINMLTGRNQAGQTLLHRACSSGSYNNVVDLLNQGADINAQDNAQWTPLHEAALAGHTEVVELLLSRGAQPNAKGHGNDTALHDAAQNEHEDVVKLLLEYGADPDFKNCKGEKPCDVCEDDRILELLKTGARGTKKADVRHVESPISGSLATSIASQSSKSGSNGFYSQSTTKGQSKPKRYKEGSADINMSDDGRSASEERPTQMSRDERKMQQLLSTIRMQEQMEERKKAKKRRPKRVSEDEGDDDEDSKPSRSKDTISVLSNSWKNPHSGNSTSNSNQSNNSSSNNQHTKLTQNRTLTKSGKNGSRTRSSRSEDRNDSDSGPDISLHSRRSFQRSTGDRIRIDHRYKDSSGRTQLHQWAEAGDIELVGNLLEGGAERDPKDHEGSTPLHLAAKAGNTEVIVLLLAYGSNVNAQDQEKSTALHEAVRNHHLEAVRLLLQNNATVTLRDSMKRNCLDLSSSKDTEIRTLLKSSLEQAEAKAKERSNKRLSQSIESRGSPKHKERKTHRESDSDEPAKPKKRNADRREGDEKKKQHARNGSVGHQKSSSMTAISVSSHPKKLSSSSSTTPTTTAPTSSVPWKANSDMEGVESTMPHKKRQPSSQRSISSTGSNLQPTEEEPEVRPSSGSSKKRRETEKHSDGYGGKVKIKKEREDDAQIFRTPGISSKPDELRRVVSTPSFSKDSKQSRHGSTKSSTSLSLSRPSSVFGMPLGSSVASISPPLTETSTSPPPPTNSLSHPSQEAELLQRSRKRSSQTFSSPSGYLKFTDDLKQATPTKQQNQHQRQRSLALTTSGSRPAGSDTVSSAAVVSTAISADMDVSRKKAKTSTADSITESMNNCKTSISSTADGIVEHDPSSPSLTQTATVPINNNPILPSSDTISMSKEQASSVLEMVKNPKIEETVKIVKAESPPPASRSLQDAQRYLPLYTVPLSSEVDQAHSLAAPATAPEMNGVDTSQQQRQFGVLDRQVQLLLGLTGLGSLYSRYPHLHRRLVTEREKDRLWSPLSSMVSERCAAAVKLNYEVLPVECQFSSWSTATTAMMRLKEHEKQKFLSCELYFIRLDEVIDLIRKDYPQLEESMMTITLDIGYDEEADMEADLDMDVDIDKKVKKEDETLKTVKEEAVEETVHLTTSISSSSVSTTTSLTSLASSASSSSLGYHSTQGDEALSARTTSNSRFGASGLIHKLRRVPAKMAAKAMFKELQQQHDQHS